MKNKRVVYFLLPLVLVVWGLIFYKLFAGFEKNKDNIENQKTFAPNKTKNKLSVDTISIHTNYRDPFLNGDNLPKSHETAFDENMLNDRNELVTSSPLPKPQINIPEIKYFGVITNCLNREKKIGMFRIGGKDCILKETGMFNDFRILRLFNDSVCIAYHHIKKTVKKES